eukprot:m.89700 g.89700  ORF g.89700 m.89700 type:complete len:956 (+) comp8838_c0_seq2:127-2994(+)
MSDETEQMMVECLQQTLSQNGQARREAEKYLESVDHNEGFLMLLVRVMVRDDVDKTVRQAASIAFKNCIKRRWSAEENPIAASDKGEVKENIIQIMINTPDYAQKQICDAIAQIAESDFPENWLELVPSLKEHIESNDFHVIAGVLQAADPIFWKYRYAARSDELWTEIQYVLDGLAEPLTNLFQNCLQNIQENANNLGSMGDTLTACELVLQIFQSLNSQDIPEFFENHLKLWSDGFLELLKLPEIPDLATSDPEIPGIVEKVKSQISVCVSLYAQKYDEEFQDYLPSFVDVVWNLLTTTTLDMKNDYLVCTAMAFLTCVASRQHNQDLFSNEDTLKAICEQVIIPNMKLRESDEEMFNFDPDEYIRRDMEGSDVDTRRRAANDLVRGLCVFFEDPVTDIFTQYVSTLLEEYESNPGDNWQSKDCAIFLITSLAVRSKTVQAGTTKTNEKIPIEDTFNSVIAVDLQGGTNDVLVADALKYVFAFRGQLSNDLLNMCFPVIINHLVSESNVVNSYAACCVERLLYLKREKMPVITAETVQGCLEALLTNLFDALNLPDNGENEYIMKAIMRTIVSCKEAVSPYIFLIIEKLSEKLLQIAKNPGNARFTHYLFESLGCAIRFSCGENVSLVESFEEALFPPFQTLIENEIEEFQPYIFQLLAQLLELRPAPIPEPYLNLFPSLPNPMYWETGANTVPLVRLLRAFISTGGGELFGSEEGQNQLRAILGVFQKLIASRRFDLDGFSLIQTMIEHLPAEVLNEYMSTVITLILTRMTKQKTANFISGFITFACFLAGIQGAEACIQQFESVKQGLFTKVINRIVEDVAKVSGSVERKICVVGMIRLLSSNVFVQQYENNWATMLYECVKVVELPPEEAEEEELEFDSSEQSGYKAKYVKLAYAGAVEYDPFTSIGDMDVFIGQSLGTIFSQFQELQNLISQDIAPTVNKYLLSAGISL